MNKRKMDLLYKYHNRACHNLMCYSKNMLMTEPKEGYENEWQQAKEECRLLDEMIKETAQGGQLAEKKVYADGIHFKGNSYFHPCMIKYIGSKLAIRELAGGNAIEIYEKGELIGLTQKCN